MKIEIIERIGEIRIVRRRLMGPQKSAKNRQRRLIKPKPRRSEPVWGGLLPTPNGEIIELPVWEPYVTFETFETED